MPSLDDQHKTNSTASLEVLCLIMSNIKKKNNKKKKPQNFIGPLHMYHVFYFCASMGFLHVQMCVSVFLCIPCAFGSFSCLAVLSYSNSFVFCFVLSYFIVLLFL